MINGTEIPIWFIDDQLTDNQKHRLVVKWEIKQRIEGVTHNFPIKEIAERYYMDHRTAWKYVHEVRDSKEGGEDE